MLEEGVSDHRHERMTVKALPGPSLEVVKTEFFFHLLADPTRALSGADQSRHNLVSGGSKDPNHDAAMRIGSEAPKRRTHPWHKPGPATSNRTRRPSQADSPTIRRAGSTSSGGAVVSA